MKAQTKTIVLYATLGALIFLAMTLDRAITPYLPLSAAFITLTVTFVFALINPELATSVASGIIFGVSSCITAIFFGKSSVINPLISVLPRALLGFIIFGVYKLCRLIFNGIDPRAREIASISIASAVTTVMNTVLFLTALVLFGENNTIDSVFKVTVLANSIPEFVMTAILVPIVTTGVRHGLNITVDAPKAETTYPTMNDSQDSDNFDTAEFIDNNGEQNEKKDSGDVGIDDTIDNSGDR